MKIHALAAVVSLSLLGTDVAFAYNYIDYCNGSPIGWSNAAGALNVADASFPAGSSWANSLNAAISRINDNPSKFTFRLIPGDTSVAVGNGQSEIWFSSSSQYSPAVTYNYTVCSWSGTAWVAYIQESDVVFYNAIPYTSNMSLSNNLYGYGGPNRPFETTAIHELGHSLGLGHVNTEYNIMGTDYYHLHANGGVGRSYLGEDASDGAVNLYGLANTVIQDLSLVHWKWTGASGQYSSHGHTVLYDATGSVLPSALDAGETRYTVNGGQTIQMELTAENNGRSSQTPRIGYYLSTDNLISPSDTLITTETRTVTRANVDTYRKTLTVPAGLPTGKYWLGAIIDDNSLIAERVENNNAAYFPISYVGGGTPTNQPPTANFGFTTNGLVASFTDSSTDPDGSIASRSWNFGDGTSSTATSPSKTYAAAGTYTVQLTVTDNQGATNAISKSVTVTAGGLPECTGDPTSLGKNCARSNLSATAGNYVYMYVYIPQGTAQLRINSSGGTGNADLYVNTLGNWATTTSHNYRSTNTGNTESVTVNNPPSGYVYISLYGASSFSGVKVTTQY